jgi:hypothetical protein
MFAAMPAKARAIGDNGGFVDATTWVALARHAGAAVACAGTLAVAAPRTVWMVLADPAGVVANQARHEP